MNKRTHFTAIVILGWALCVGGCAELHQEGTLPEQTGALSALPPPSNQRPSDEAVMEGQMKFTAGDYGLAEQNFRSAVEANPLSAPAWLGLAASYDRLSRYDLAKRAYEQVIRLEGRTPTVLNNLGYHYMLQGRLGEAKTTLEEAARLDPDNDYIQGNLQLVASWSKGERHPDDIPRRH